MPQYADCASDEAFERMFERDKDDLREMGIPLETGSNDVLFDDEIGYRIPREAYALPDIAFDAEELAVLGVAARMWQHATLAGATGRAIRKLEAAGVDVDREALGDRRASRSTPQSRRSLPSGTPFNSGRRVRFDYATRGGPLPPSGMWSRGVWSRGTVGGTSSATIKTATTTRVFRLSRVHGDVTAHGAVVRSWSPPGSTSASRCACSHDRLPPRTRVCWSTPDAHSRSVDAARYSATTRPKPCSTCPSTTSSSLRPRSAGFGPAVEVLAPEALRETVARRLQAVLAALAPSKTGEAL